MDSANSSSSLQSNDGGDDEFDSRSNSLSSFQYSSTDATPRIAALQPPPPPPPLSSSLNHHFFDSPSGLGFTPLFADLSSSSPAPTTFAGIHFGVGQSSVQALDKSRTTTAAAEPPQSSRKRTRASRRAPTTVLTTDTSNFRAMVQEFTGIPSLPLAAAPSPYVHPRLSLLQSSVGFHNPPSPLPPPPLPFFFQRPLPFMQRAQSPISAAGAAQSQALLSMRSPNLALQSLLQPSFLAKNSILPTMSAQLETRPRTPPPSGDALNELQLPRGLFASEDIQSIYSGADRNSGSQQRVMSSTACKLNYSGSNSPELNVEKVSAAETRGEGIVDSWICSSE